ncbi:MAG: 6-phosphogluconolactonase [Verrucomicrobia subdivision 3 bacterium]|nr:6-phosphogluconolactonase [Limisphaerales bacterium]
MTYFETAQALAQAAAEEWCQQIERAEQSFTVALSGGRIAKDFFGAIVVKSQRRKGICNAHFFWADERCVPPDDADSNYRMARELLFDPLQINPSRVHRIRGEDSPPQAAAAASQELLLVTKANPDERPVLDWVFLGMGEDGHVASLFPGTSMPGGQVYVPVTAPKPPPNRITLIYEVIAAARQVWVLVSGKGKEEALHKALSGDGQTPLATVLRSRTATRIFSDISLEK